MDIYHRRRTNLLEVLKEMPASDLSKASGVAASSIGSIFKQLPDGRFARNIGERTARNLERGARKPEGFLDQPVKETAAPAASESALTYARSQHTPVRIEDAMETLRLALVAADALTRAQAKPIIDLLFADPENAQHLGPRMATTLGIMVMETHRRAAA